jgi:hypothetical protein
MTARLRMTFFTVGVSYLTQTAQATSEASRMGSFRDKAFTHTQKAVASREISSLAKRMVLAFSERLMGV